jgi:hypothetical protein
VPASFSKFIVSTGRPASRLLNELPMNKSNPDGKIAGGLVESEKALNYQAKMRAVEIYTARRRMIEQAAGWL